MLLLYNVGIRLYALIISLSSLFNRKARLFREGRRYIWQNLTEFRKENGSNVSWFHAASLGEFEQGLPVMEAFKATFPNQLIVVSFFSPSGYEQRRNHPVADFTCYLPLDTRRNAQRFLNILKPSQVFFIKYEYWYHYLNQINNKSIPLYSLSALFTSKHIFFKKHGTLHRKMLKFFIHTFVQNSKSRLLLESIGIDEVTVSGDTRFDRVKQTVSSPDSFSDIESFCKNSKVLILGSVWSEDMEVVANFINQNTHELKIIIAPHLIEATHIQKIIRNIQLPYSLYSQGEISMDKPILILDTIGMLSSVYQYGDIAYIGGAFGDGLHNILEAVAFGLPVVFGNKGLEKFPEADELITLGGAFSVNDSHMAQEVLENLMIDDFRKGASDICINYVNEHTGATDTIMSYLKSHLK